MQNFSGPVAQLVEQIPFKDKVPGSSPGRPTNTKTLRISRRVFDLLNLSYLPGLTSTLIFAPPETAFPR